MNPLCHLGFQHFFKLIFKFCRYFKICFQIVKPFLEITLMLIAINELLSLWYMLHSLWVMKLHAFLIEVHKVHSAAKLVNIFLTILIKLEVSHKPTLQEFVILLIASKIN